VITVAGTAFFCPFISHFFIQLLQTMRGIVYLFIIVSCWTVSALKAQPVPHLGREDKIRIREAIAISDKAGEKIWTGISTVPFTLLLVTDSVEFLINHPNPSREFLLSEKDSILKTDIFYRKRQFSPKLLATFPAVNGVNCIVVGTPAATGQHTTGWIITLLHEHFHQYEYSSPGYYKAVEKLELSGGDKTGMWMLNYPFEYERSSVIERYQKYTETLFRIIADTSAGQFPILLKNYKKARNEFMHALEPADYRYFSFQLWQEGIARYTEYKFLELLGAYTPSEEVMQLPDFIPFQVYREKLYSSQMKNLSKQQLNEDKRECFYSAGFAEGVLLDKINPAWRSAFLKDRFYLENYRK
jgi:hypothetical protein